MPRIWPAVWNQLALLLAAVLALVAFWWLGELIGFPRYRGYNASLLLQPLASAKVLAVVAAVALLTTLCTLLAGRVRYDAGWACVALGLYALRARGGTIEPAIRGQPQSVFLTLAIELALLGLIMGAAWGLLHILRERGSAFKSLRRILELPDARTRLADRKAAAESLDQKLLATLMTTVVMTVLMLILCQDSDRGQVFFAVGASAYIAVWTAHAFIPTRPGGWFWAGPILCGIAGYLWAWLNTPDARLAIGEPGGFLAALARPLPLDYASIGLAAALWRYVQSRTHQMRRIIEQQREASKPPDQPAPAPGAA